jgi:hypothetical protein
MRDLPLVWRYFLQPFKPLVVALSIGLFTPLAQAATFDCGGPLEQEVWAQWSDKGMRFASEQLIKGRLVEQGDTYALYDFQTFYHNLLSMAQRCQRVERMQQMAEIVSSAYTQLATETSIKKGRAWVCKGGRICNSANRLIHTEVDLNSVQFLAFATSLAGGLSRIDSTSQASNKYVQETLEISLEHIRRWSGEQELKGVQERRRVVASQVGPSTPSKLFFLDRDLWRMAVISDVAYILSANKTARDAARVSNEDLASMRQLLSELLQLFSQRTTTATVPDPQTKANVEVADLDAGYWKHYPDNRYAGYTAAEKPVECLPSEGKKDAHRLQVRVAANTVAPVPNLGWDISHARRLVHFFDAMQRNRVAASSVLGIPGDTLPSEQTMTAYAKQLKVMVWNQDKEFPLFKNYLGGANGWYRVAYNNGTGECREGTPPFGLTDSFPTGGMATWGKFDAQLHQLGVRIFSLSRSTEAKDKEFAAANYPRLSQAATGNTAVFGRLMFWPTLIGN